MDDPFTPGAGHGRHRDTSASQEPEWNRGEAVPAPVPASRELSEVSHVDSMHSQKDSRLRRGSFERVRSPREMSFYLAAVGAIIVAGAGIVLVILQL